MQIIDTHCHAFPDFLAEKAINQLGEHSGDYHPFTDGTIKNLLGSMDQAGIKCAMIANIATKPEQTAPILEWSKEINSERILPLGPFHPKSKNWRTDIDNIKTAGLLGIKLHPMYQDFTVDEDKMIPIYEYIAQKKLFVLFHAGYDIAFPGDRRAVPARFAKIKKEVPQLIFTAAHLGGWQIWENVLEELAGLDIYLDTSFIQEVPKEILNTILSKHSMDRILFGTDSPWLDQSLQVQAVLQLKLSDDIKEKIFYKNTLTLINDLKA